MAKLTWSARRKLMYTTATTIVAVVVLVFIWAKFFSAAPTCFDGRQDGSEAGIDCGGSCSLVCQGSATLPQVVWARAFPIGTNTYALAAYLNNVNPGAGAHGVPYAFQLYDSDNKLILEKDGVIDIPPVQTIPVVEPSVSTGQRAVAHVVFSFDDSVPVAWRATPASAIPSLHVSAQQLSSDASRLEVTVDNNSIFDAPSVTIVAILYDQHNVARAASKSLIPNIAHRSSAQVTFTWPTPNPNITRTEITILPSF